jgi:DNA-binding transcriptional regulator YiaG
MQGIDLKKIRIAAKLSIDETAKLTGLSVNEIKLREAAGKDAMYRALSYFALFALANPDLCGKPETAPRTGTGVQLIRRALRMPQQRLSALLEIEPSALAKWERDWRPLPQEAGLALLACKFLLAPDEGREMDYFVPGLTPGEVHQMTPAEERKAERLGRMMDKILCDPEALRQWQSKMGITHEEEQEPKPEFIDPMIEPVRLPEEIFNHVKAYRVKSR